MPTHRRLSIVLGTLLGLILFVTGLNKLLWFAPMPKMSPELTALMSALKQTGYFLPLLGICELLAGALLLTRRLIALALLIAAPIVVNVAMVHLFLDRMALPIAAVLVILEASLAWIHRGAFAGLFAPVSCAHEGASEDEPSPTLRRHPEGSL